MVSQAMVTQVGVDGRLSDSDSHTRDTRLLKISHHSHKFHKVEYLLHQGGKLMSSLLVQKSC